MKLRFVCIFVLWCVSQSESDRYFGIHSSEEVIDQQPSLLEALISHGFGLLDASAPTVEPSAEPSAQPSVSPTRGPTVFNSLDPSVEPSPEPTAIPTINPTAIPTDTAFVPSPVPTAHPTTQPSIFPTMNPSVQPSDGPSVEPSAEPTLNPTADPSMQPTLNPTDQSTLDPTLNPTVQPTEQPSANPSVQPSEQPTVSPTIDPSTLPTEQPTAAPSLVPSLQPSLVPSGEPSVLPSVWPTMDPSTVPTPEPSLAPSVDPTIEPSVLPSVTPSEQPTSQPSSKPSRVPSSAPSSQPTNRPTSHPTNQPTTQPSARPTMTPSSAPSTQPSSQPTSRPSREPSAQPSKQPSARPTTQPTAQPSGEPTSQPSGKPSTQPSAQPSSQPSSHPSTQPSAQPSVQPSVQPSAQPSNQPSTQPTTQPSLQPSAQPTTKPSPQPTPVPSAPPGSPTVLPTSLPTFTTAAPVISAIATSATRSTITISANFTLPAYYSGVVYCAAFVNTSVVIASNDNIIAAGTSTSYAAGQIVTKITIPGLSALVSYVTYCTVRTFDGTTSALFDTRATKRLVQTTCCKLLSFTNAPSFVYGSLSKYTAGQTKQYVFSYTLSSKPGVKVIVTPTVRDSAGNLVSSASLAVQPVSQRFFANSSSLSGSFVLSAALETFTGSFVVSLMPSSDSAAQYRAINSTVSVLAASAPPPTPALLSAKFGNSGATFDVTFDSATNKASLPTSFVCSALFTFQGVDSTTCVWSTSSIVRVTFASTTAALAAPGSVVTLRNGLVKAACASGQDCSAYAAAATQSTTLLAPDTPVVPMVVLQVPSAVASCDDLLVDPSLTSGNGGRAWSSVLWEITKQTSTATSSDAALLTIFESYNGSTASVITIPKADLTVALYTLTLTVTNFLGQVGTVSVMFSIDSNPNIPTLTIPGPSVVNIIPSDSLLLSALTTLPSCAQAGVIVAYRWKVFHNSIERRNIVSTSADPARFRLSPYTLTMLSVYSVELTAAVNATSMYPATSASVTFTVRVGQGAVVAMVTGGSSRFLASTSPFTLDASASYDQNFPPGQSVTALSYEWTCRILSAAQFGESCENLLPVERTSAVLRVGATPLTLGTQYEFIVTVSSPDGRSSDYAVSVQNSPGATLTSINNVNVVKVDPRARLALSGFITGGYALDASWTASIDGVTQVFEASCPLFQTFAMSEVQNTLSYPLSIPGSTFPAGAAVSFRLLAYQSGTAGTFSSYSDITVFMNAPPSGGLLSVTPSSGVALNTSFLLMATSWSDEPEDYPLTYAYAYMLTDAAPQLTIQSQSTSNKVTTMLPAGLISRSKRVFLLCEVFDSYMSGSTVSASVVVVSANTTLNVLSYVDTALTAALATGNINAASQVIANAASTMNLVNCSNAGPSVCAGLNRDACYATPQTCSGCLEGYTGILGDSNAPCYNASMPVTLGDVGSTCTADAECALNSCVSNICTAPVLVCPSENNDVCSGHGQCVYQDGTGNAFDYTCTLLDVTCFAVCRCDSGYGGSSCALDVAELISRDTTRAALCNAVLTVGAASDASYLMLNSLVSALYATYDPFEVSSAESVQLCTNALTTLSGYAAQGYLSDEATFWILQTTSKFIQPLASNSTVARRLKAHRGLTATDGNAMDAAASAIISGMLDNLVVGQNAVNFADVQMQIIVLKALGSSVSKVTPPVTATSSAYGSGLTGSIELSAGTAALLRDTGGYVQVAVLMWGSNPFADSQALVSPLLRLQIAAMNVSDQEIVALNTTFGNQPAFYVTLQFNTVQDFNLSLTIDEAMLTGAPNFTVPSCATRIPDGYEHCPCAVTSYSNYNVTFGCKLEALFPVAAGDGRRRMQSEGSSKIVQFGSILANLDNELTIYLSKNPFEVDFQKARIVLIFLSALSLVILLGYVMFRYWDIVDQKYLVQEKAARDQRHFKERHAELLAVRALDRNTSIKAMDWHKDPPNRLADAMSTAFKTHWASPGPNGSPSKKRDSVESTGFVDIYAVNSALADIFDYEIPSTRTSGSLQIAPNAGRKDIASDSKHNTSRNQLYRSESTYSVQYDAPHSGLDAGWEREFFVSNSVAHYLTTILPKGSLGDAPGLFETLLRYHKYTAAFVGRSLQHTRVLRWTNVCLGLLVTLFINTLIYGIFYPDEGDCQDKLTRDDCLSEMSSVYDAKLCRWTADAAVIEGGNCSLNPPPQYFVFIIVVVLITVLISLPVQFAYEYLLFTVCMRRPRLEFCGLTSAFWLGESTQKGELDQSVQSPLKGLHEEAAAKHWTTQRPGNLNRTVSQMFHQEMHPRLEADALLLSVNQALEARIYGEKLPWKSVGQTGRSQNLRAIQTRLGIYANGTPVALTGLQWLRFGNRKEELVREIKTARQSAKKLQEHVDSLNRTDIRGREKMLFQYFILEQFSSFKKFLLRRFLFDFADTTPHTINPFVWLLAWAFVILSMGFFLYWGFIWAASQGGSTAENWGINLGSTIAQDVLIIQVFRVYFIYSLSMLSLKPQLRAIYRVLHRVCVDYAQDQLEADGLEIAVVQHLSPACRASHSDVCAQLSAARVLRHVNDSDVEQCKQSYNARMAIAASAVLSIPLLLAVLSEIAGTSFMESLLPAFLDALLVSNYYFYSAAGLFILVPYLVIFGVFLWYYLFRKVRAASYRHNAFFYSSMETDSDSGVAVTQQWNTSERSNTQTGSTFVNIWQTNQKKWRSWWSGAYDKQMHKFDLQWEIMNRPASLQAVESAVSPTSRLKKQQRKSPTEKIASVEAAKAGMKIPGEVTDMTVGGSGDWLEVWAESSRSPRGSRSGNYLTDLMNRGSSHSQAVSSRRFSQNSSVAGGESHVLQLSAPLQQDEDSDSDRGSFGDGFLEPSQRGFTLQRTFSDDRQRLDPLDEKALDSILNNFRHCVQSGRMRLVDSDESEALETSSATTCNVLVEFFDLRILLEEHLAQQKPYGRALSADEKTRIVDSCYHWVSGLGDEMLQQHYQHDKTKIAAATLVRSFSSSFSPPVSPFASPRSASSKGFGGSSFKASRGKERINFSVPFQEFRRWAQHSGGMLSGFNPQDSRSMSRRSSKSFGGSVRMELEL